MLPQNFPEVVSKAVLTNVDNGRGAIAVYVSQTGLLARSFAQLSLDVMRDHLRNLSEKYEIYICPSCSEELLWAAMEWPNYRIILQPKGENSLERARGTISSLLKVGHKKVSVILDGMHFSSEAYIKSSFNLLNWSDIVIAPLEKGGLYLITAQRELPRMHSLTENSESICKDLLLIAQRYKMTVGQLPVSPVAKSSKSFLHLFSSDLSKSHPLVSRWLAARAKVSIIIPVHNDEKIVESLVDGLRQLDPSPERIFVDRGSKDATVPLLHAMGEKVVHIEKQYRATALNYGATLAEGDYLLFLYPETKISQQAYTKMITHLDGKEIEAGSFTSKLEKTRKNSIIDLVERGGNIRSALFKTPYIEQGYFITQDGFERVGCYKEVAILEDVEWFERMKSYCRYTIVEEPVETSGKKMYKNGVARHTIKNSLMIALYKLGVRTERLTKLRVNSHKERLSSYRTHMAS
jgi:hypothetical protein